MLIRTQRSSSFDVNEPTPVRTQSKDSVNNVSFEKIYNHSENKEENRRCNETQEASSTIKEMEEEAEYRNRHVISKMAESIYKNFDGINDKCVFNLSQNISQTERQHADFFYLTVSSAIFLL